jgi:putative lipoprotein
MTSQASVRLRGRGLTNALLAATSALIACVSATKSAAAAGDDWLGPDKFLHFGVAAAIAGGGYAVSSLAFDERWQRAVSGGAAALAAGAGKELYDLSGAGDPSWKDFAWDVAGAAVGVGIALAIDLALDEGETDRTSARALAVSW